MLTDKQSLLLCGILAGAIFVGGVLDILSNFIVQTVLTLIFITIILNIFYTNGKYKERKKRASK
ncbi:hypothetical protein GCM10022291_31530 [Postechiella marina]|uniref:Uncharacterized protein n=1 Tax=Postechiella marina TaxID=943941 RepID=A0ABP8CGE5_9FLAO